jgi:hypothetical protein
MGANSSDWVMVTKLRPSSSTYWILKRWSISSCYLPAVISTAKQIDEDDTAAIFTARTWTRRRVLVLCRCDKTRSNLLQNLQTRIILMPRNPPSSMDFGIKLKIYRSVYLKVVLVVLKIGRTKAAPSLTQRGRFNQSLH